MAELNEVFNTEQQFTTEETNKESFSKTVDVIKTEPFQMKSEFSKSLSMTSEEHHASKQSELVFVQTNPSADDFKSFGVRDISYGNRYSKNKMSPFKQIRVSIQEDKTQVKSSNSEVVKNNELGFSAPTTPTRDLVNCRSFTYVKEKPSSSDAALLTVSQNIITVSSTQKMEVTESKEDGPDYWEVDQGYQVIKLLDPMGICPFTRGGSKTYIEPSEHAKFALCLDSEDTDDVCQEFLSPVSVAQLVISNTIQLAKEKHQMLICNYGDPDRWDIPSYVEPTKVCSRWPSIKSFTRENGLISIETYIIESSQFYEDWKYTISFDGARSDQVSDHYYYKVRFGLPNKLYPIPQVTANMFFHVEVSRVIPPQCAVKVLFSLESMHHKIYPDNYTLKDGILMRILEIKLQHFQSLTF